MFAGMKDEELEHVVAIILEGRDRVGDGSMLMLYRKDRVRGLSYVSSDSLVAPAQDLLDCLPCSTGPSWNLG